jgi:hypothetical protein
MGLPTEIVMPGVGAANPFKIPTVGASRTYSCAAGSEITVPGEDAGMSANLSREKPRAPCDRCLAARTAVRDLARELF